MELHPATVHFPIALTFTAGACYLYALIRNSSQAGTFGFLLHAIGVGGMIAAVLTGRQAESQLVHTPSIQELVEPHESIAYLSLWLFAMMLIWQYLRRSRYQKIEQVLFTLVFWILLGVMGYGAHLGGKMVYEEGAGVKPLQEMLDSPKP